MKKDCAETGESEGPGGGTSDSLDSSAICSSSGLWAISIDLSAIGVRMPWFKEISAAFW